MHLCIINHIFFVSYFQYICRLIILKNDNAYFSLRIYCCGVFSSKILISLSHLKEHKLENCLKKNIELKFLFCFDSYCLKHKKKLKVLLQKTLQIFTYPSDLQYSL